MDRDFENCRRDASSLVVPTPRLRLVGRAAVAVAALALGLTAPAATV